jgi:glycerate 2-kinase
MARRLCVVVAPDSFGGALDSVAVADAIAAGWRRARPADEMIRVPMADGGEGTLAAVAAALGERAERRSTDAHDALQRPVRADWLLLDDGQSAFVEMAAASGLARLSADERTPASALVATTRGTGELLKSALDAGVSKVILGLGGSATNDGGAGMLAALGVRFLDVAGEELGPGGGELARLSRIDVSEIDARLASVEMVVASDVTNPLTGPTGAAATYGPQKGADFGTVAALDAALAVYGAKIEAATGRAVADLPGAGAAGGAGAALLGFTNATLRPGIEVVAEMAGLTVALSAADLVITGEGRADEQTLAGKAAMGVASIAGPRRVPVVLLCGSLGPGSEALDASRLFEVIQPVADRPMSLAESMADTERLLANAAERLAGSIGIGLTLAERTSSLSSAGER